MKAIRAKPIFNLAFFLSEAVLIGLFGATSGIFTGIGMAYVLSGMSPHSSSGGGGGTTPASVSPIFVHAALRGSS
jgi:ABC-type lipoprotein release transport system permease subunit